MAGRAREERGRGIPLNDAERAARHYGVTPEQYLRCPECYPLPERGTGLTSGSSVMDGLAIVGLVLGVSAAIGLLVNRKR